MSKSAKIWFLSLILMAAALRYNGFFSNTFANDEALFASWARLIASWQDPILANQLIDKPPLFFYLQALFFPLFGPTEWVARIPNMIASLLLVPVTGIFAWRLFHDELTAVLGAAFVAFSPLAIQFSGTGYLDPLMVFLLMSGLTLIAPRLGKDPSHLLLTKGENQPVKLFNTQLFWAGIFLGLAVATKYQALLFLPLVIGFGALGRWDGRKWLSLFAGLCSILALVWIWEFLRNSQFGLLETQLRAYGGLRLAWSWELWPRLELWIQQWQYLIHSPVLVFGFMLAFPLFLALLIYEESHQVLIDQLLVAFVLGYFILHWFIAVPVWDRYILPIVPIVGVILARFVWRITYYLLPQFPWLFNQRMTLRRFIWFVPILLIAVQAPSIIAAYQGQFPIGGTAVADHGASYFAPVLDDKPYGTVLYDHWFNWQWRYHLFDKRVYVSWFPHPDGLIEDLQVFLGKDQSRYLVLPDSAEAIPVLRRIADAGYNIEVLKITRPGEKVPGMVLYAISTD